MVGKHNHDKEIKALAKKVFYELIEDKFLDALNGNLAFRVTPTTITTTATDANVGVAAAVSISVTGDGVTASGGGNITVTVHSKGLTGGKKDVTVAVTNSNNAAAIATAIEAALKADEDVGHTSTGYFAITRSSAKVTLTSKTEEEDPTVNVEVTIPDDGGATLEEGTEFTVDVEEKGADPYTREVTIELVDSDGNRQTWFNRKIAVAITKNTSGDGTAKVSDATPALVKGIGTVTVTLIGTWADNDTNTLSVAQDTILGYTVSSVTSVETIGTPAAG